MTDNRIEELLLKFTESISELNANMKSALEKIASHEARITELEHNKTSLKDTAIQWLVKGLVASILTIASLTGASGLIIKLFGLFGA